MISRTHQHDLSSKSQAFCNKQVFLIPIQLGDKQANPHFNTLNQNSDIGVLEVSPDLMPDFVPDFETVMLPASGLFSL